VDDISIVGSIVGQSASYEIISTAGSEWTRADIAVSGGAVTIASWQVGRTQQ
jgi:hypothetical protein